MLKRFVYFGLMTAVIGSSCTGMADTINATTNASKTGAEHMYDRTDETTLNVSSGVTLSTQSGDIFRVTGTWPTVIGSHVNNRGRMTTNGVGHAVYVYPNENQKATTYVENRGTMDRIDVHLTTDSSVYNAEGSTINGSVRMGTHAVINNWGSLQDKTNDDNDSTWSMSNLVYFDNRGIFRNGFLETTWRDENNQLHLDVTLTSKELTNATSAHVTTDNLYFVQSGTLYNAGVINNKTITAVDSISNVDAQGMRLYLMNNPFYETNEIIKSGSTVDRNKSHIKYFIEERKKQTGTSGISTVDEHATLKTETVSLGDKAVFRADMGSEIVVSDQLILGQNGTLDIGADYFWKSELSPYGVNWKEIIEVRKDKAVAEVDDEGKPTGRYIRGKEDKTEKVELSAIPRSSSAAIKDFVASKNATVTLKDTTYSGETYTTSDKAEDTGSTLTMNGGSMTLTKDMKLGVGNTLTLQGYIQDEVVYSDDKVFLKSDDAAKAEAAEAGGEDADKDYVTQEFLESVLPMTDKDAKITIGGNLIAGNGAYITLLGESDENKDKELIIATSDLTVTKDIVLGDNSTFEGESGEDTDDPNPEWIKVEGLGDSFSPVTKGYANTLNADNMTFGEYGKYEGESTIAKITTDLKFGNFANFRTGRSVTVGHHAIFGDDGFFADSGHFKAEELNMGDRSTIYVLAAELDAKTFVGSNSVVNLKSDISNQEKEKGWSAGISNGLFKKEGKTNVNVYSTAWDFGWQSSQNENYIFNGVTVDNIYIQSGGLMLGSTDRTKTSSIHGAITMSDSTWLHLYGWNIDVWDPIRRQAGATNTLVWFDMGDLEEVNTHNTIDSDLMLIGGGTLNAYNTLTAKDILLDDAGGLRVFNDKLVHANVREYESAAANTTLFIAPLTGTMNSFGDIQLDRLIVENGRFNVNHTVLAKADDANTSKEGVWLGTGTTLNVNNRVQTSQLIRRPDLATTITDTTVILSNGQLVVEQTGDIDTLILNKGIFDFRNLADTTVAQADRDLKITNDVTVGSQAVFLANGTAHVNSGKVIINNGNGTLTLNGRLGNSFDPLEATDTPSVMNLKANLIMNKGSILDLRATDNGLDKISVTGTAYLGKDVRLFLRNPKVNETYTMITAAGGAAIDSSFSTSFLWEDTEVTTDGTNVTAKIGNILVLKDVLDKSDESSNVKAIGKYISDAWDGNYGPWDGIFFADNLKDAVKVIEEYIPEGYINSPQVVLHTGVSFQNNVLAELSDMRQLSVATSSGRGRSNTRRSNYYTQGRSGGDRSAYQPYPRGQYQNSSRASIRPSGSSGRKSYRTDKGGIWLKPFYMTMTQDANKGISGYDLDSYGLTAGIDRHLGRWTWGISGLYAQGDFKQDNSVIKSDIDTWGVGLYTSYQPARSQFFIDLFASYISNGNKAKHHIKSADTVLKADYDTKSFGGGMAMGYNIQLASSFYLTPKIGVNYTRLSSDDVEEEGNAPIVMKIKTPNINSIRLPIELRAAFPIAGGSFELLPEAHVRYTHDFGDTDYQSKVYIKGLEKPIKLDNVGMPENMFTVGGSLAWTFRRHELSGRYDYDTGSGMASHTFGLGYKFLF